MSKKEKLINRFKTIPADFTWDETIRLMSYVQFEKIEGDGSRVKFKNADNIVIDIHKPHPGSIVKKYALRKIKSRLEEYGYL